ncbi:MAG: ChrR family anti-sigma-E factor, partial [Alphaproteobacteria bacterium]|nr:ChrR family anti-sigma-E factor [Alphaproteobacteria bacterium]
MKEICPSLYGEYAAGTMDEGLALIVASYLSVSGCPEARAQVGTCHKLAGTMLETLCEPVEMTEGSLQSVLAKLDQMPDPCAGKAPIALCDDLTLPAPIAALMGCHGGKLKWRSIGGGSKMAVLPRPACGSHMMALHIAPGRKLPEHKHEGLELTLVLRGAYSDEQGTYVAGTLTCNEPGTTHNPVAHDTDGCVCISAVKGMVFT